MAGGTSTGPFDPRGASPCAASSPSSVAAATGPPPHAAELLAPARARAAACSPASPTTTSSRSLADAAGRVEARRPAPARACPASRRCSATASLLGRRRARSPATVDDQIARPRGPPRRRAPVAATDELEAVNAALIRAEGRGLGGRSATGCAPLGPSPTSPGPTPAPAAIEAYTSVQLALSALDRLEVRGRDSAGLHLLVRDHGLDLDVAGGGRAARRARADDPLFASCAVRTPDGPPELRLQGGGRDRRAGRQHARRCATPIRRRRRCCAGARRRPTRRGRRARPHPVGQRRHHLPGQRPPAEQPRSSTGPAGPYVTAALNGDVDNFADLKATEGLRIAAEITTDAKVIPTLVSPPARRRRRRSTRRSGARSPRFEGSVAIGGQRRRRPRPSCCSPCGAAARRSTSASPRTPSSWPASRTAWSRRRDATCAWTARRRPTPTTPTPAAARSSCSTAPRPARSRASAASPTTAPSCRSPPTSSPTRRDHHPRHRPRRLPALPAQGDHRGAGVVPQDAAGQARRARRRARASRLGDRDAARRRCASRLRDGVDPPGARDRPGHRRGRRPEPGRGLADGRRRRPTCRVEAVLATELSASGCAPT